MDDGKNFLDSLKVDVGPLNLQEAIKKKPNGSNSSGGTAANQGLAEMMNDIDDR